MKRNLFILACAMIFGMAGFLLDPASRKQVFDVLPFGDLPSLSPKNPPMATPVTVPTVTEEPGRTTEEPSLVANTRVTSIPTVTAPRSSTTRPPGPPQTTAPSVKVATPGTPASSSPTGSSPSVETVVTVSPTTTSTTTVSPGIQVKVSVEPLLEITISLGGE